ncbi:MAG: tripartite tricarboxylate transporter permease [Paracoccus sp. (in: a-proteobacteria)]|jgi:TctA family transporter|uniref:tripartite tricarboxylate transporter permease n=3 Tax=Paracoccus TaxID=265 RepID=UPI000C676DDC|nr:MULTISPECIES: tripartite tricarboxylate transporter permease [unclassified Paracoccus (in: a-proteobacteria)]MBA50191.1 C4-dicarboxylate ABC transporter permease [Paracoccus sp. (in: a-proteobacteria)]MCS5602630.1 tripartite tricarboxylate transporter permease [Paracoccus sp. (in: a-proteobacteria)]|tara:strand:- start:6487 stop:7989 length:1503 start_codon:yes stop_codon:yes gene_type:complete
MDNILNAFTMIADPSVLGVIIASSLFGLFVGAIPGLSATMATALLVPLTFFMDPLPAIASIVSAVAMAIFAGDIPGAMLRIPGTPASAAYVDDAYQMTLRGEAERALGIGLVSSVFGGFVGAIILTLGAPFLAEFAFQFSTVEYFWLAVLGLSCSVIISRGSPIKGLVSLLIGLFISTIGIDVTGGYPRFTFGSVDLMGGVSFIPAMIGMFAVTEILRFSMNASHQTSSAPKSNSTVYGGQWKMVRENKRHLVSGSLIGTVIGILPGAGADIAAWVAYAMAKKISRTPAKFGTGHPEGLASAGAANNAALSGVWIPALVFGIPGDSVTAIAVGVLFMKGITPGPMVFVQQADLTYAIFLTFFLSNLLLLVLGYFAIRGARFVVQTPARLLMPVILLFCIVGSFAITNSVFGIAVMLVLGVLGFLMEENGFPIAPAILGIVIGPMLEDNFMATVIKSDGGIVGFFDRPVSGALGAFTILIWVIPLVTMALRRRSQRIEAGA